MEAVPYQPVYIYEDNILIATAATDSDGVVEYEYSSIASGEHTITVRSPHLNGFEAASKSITINVIFVTSMEITPWYTYDLPFGAVKELKATLRDNMNNPVPDKPITFSEGYRVLGTVKTDNEGNARINYLESDNRGTPTSITLTQNPQFYDNINSVVEGVLTTIDGTPLADKNVALFHEYNGHLLSFDDTDSNGRFSIMYGSLASDVPLHFYVAYRSRIMDSTNNEYVYYEPTFTPLGEKLIMERPEYMENISSDIITLRSDEKNNHWYINRVYTNKDNMSSATSKAPSIVAGNYDCGVNTNLYQSLPYGENWIIRLTCEITGDVAIQYNNIIDGNITLQNGVNGFKIYDNTQNYNNGTSVSTFTDNNVTVNTLYIIREANDITFKYTSATGELVTYNRNYTNLSLAGSLYIRVANGSCIFHELQMIETGDGAITSNYTIKNQQGIYEGFDLTKWTYGTAPVINDDGMTLVSGTYNYNVSLPAGDWRLAIEMQVYGNGATIQYSNSTDGRYQIRPNKVNPLIVGYDSNGTEIIRTVPDAFINNDGDINTLLITRENNKITFQYVNNNGELVSYPRTYNSLTATGRIAFVDSSGDANYVIVRSITLLERMEDV